MGRCTVTRWAFVAGLLCFCGCTGPQTFSPFGWMHGSDASQASTKTDKSNPLKPADEVASDDDASGAKGGSDAAASDSKSPDKPGKNGFKTAAIDPELRKLMEGELAFEPPSERQRLFIQWSKFDPAFIHELVDNHRMAREIAENRDHPVKLASADVPQDRSGQAPDMDFQASPKSPAANAIPVETPTARQSPPATQGAVSPWSESSDMPVVPTTPAPSSNSASGAPGTTSSSAGTQAAGAASNGPSSADAFDSLDAPAPTTHPTSIVPQTPSQAPPQGAAGRNAAKTAPAQIDTAPPAAQTSSTPAVAAPSTRSDAFSGMGSFDDGPAPTTPTPRAAAPTNAPATTVTTSVAPGMPPANTAAKMSDGLLIQPGVAAPADLISNLRAQTKGTRDSAVSGDGNAVSATPSIDAPAAVRPANSTNAADSVQPVQLQPPTDVPSSSPVASAGPDAKSTPTADTPSPPASGAANTSPSGLAGFGNRLIGAISPSLNSATRKVVQSDNWHDELQKIVTFAASEAGQTSVGTTDAEKLKYVEKQVHLRMLYLLSGQPAKSLEPISGLDAPDQEFWQQVFWGLSNYFDKTAMVDPSDRATQTIAQLRTAVQHLKEKSKLELRNVAFCQKISSYGNYERVKRDEFTAGQSILLYAEVENFKSEPTTEGPYRTILKSTVEIFDSRGQMVVKMPFQAPDDLCANPRRDYYNTYEFAIPQRIGLGPHTLKLTVEDQISRKVATYTVNFTVK